MAFLFTRAMNCSPCTSPLKTSRLDVFAIEKYIIHELDLESEGSELELKSCPSILQLCFQFTEHGQLGGQLVGDLLGVVLAVNGAHRPHSY